MQKTRAHLSQLCVSATLRPCVISEERKDAMTQGRKDWKPQNPSESGKMIATESTGAPGAQSEDILCPRSRAVDSFV
uniref:Uncharacterized protein n=1 Tax=Candidatus Methanogaster sp. ANME-2c ERB4 TaxID=2759911 RepID=A0A7G9YB39_9EURY|nr:hypothetical protein PLNDPPDD_00012 [Methanosarcinales archaeon ANME-2c ERB4]QNO43938.1 hypothetical protein NANOEKIO_00038 [Methanosarcinales archaeon ANME-2c ERB4]QNO44491.1 hypothetical protein ELEJOALA_00038 [Methanosarcinales archaeon ANME-2c ERB4]QNO44606.1 hypothetical protein JBICLBBK_00009 [Methanosarcinales archaeon ANME-2c ERB4]QNO45223.1 hypothetical protein KDMJNAGO_00038 [Methanosarcinales archaeon ANME-2c ERB4]